MEVQTNVNSKKRDKVVDYEVLRARTLLEVILSMGRVVPPTLMLGKKYPGKTGPEQSGYDEMI